MDAIVDGCSIEQDALEVEEYGDEVMSAGWNPQLTLVEASPVALLNQHVNLHPDLANIDIDTFLQKMYEYQC